MVKFDGGVGDFEHLLEKLRIELVFLGSLCLCF